MEEEKQNHSTHHHHHHRHHHHRKASFKRLLTHKIFRVRNIFSFLSIVLSTIFIISLFVLNVLPINYTLLILLILIIINIFCIYAINVHNKTILKIIGWLLLIITMIGSVIGSYYSIVTNNFFNKSFNRIIDVSTTTYYVVSKRSNEYTKSDIKDEVSFYNNTYNIEAAYERLSEGFNITKKEYDDLGLMFNDILNNNSKFMLIDSSSYELVFSIDNTLNKEEYSIIYEFTLTTKNIKNESNKVNKFNVFIAGRDFSGFFDYNSIASINLDKHTAILTSIPRDYYIELPDSNTKEKLSFMGLYGADTNKKALEKLFGITIDYTIYVDASSVVDIVDYIGGIEYCSEEEYTTSHAMVVDTYNDSLGKKLHIKKGCQHLNGIEALTVSRERLNIVGGDHQRQKNCQQILISIMKKLTTPKNALNYSRTLNELNNVYETDMNRKVISNLSKDIINNGTDKWTIISQSVDGTDAKDIVHIVNREDWITYPDQTTVDKCKKEIDKLLK